jgi:hypothetical protein
MQSGFVVFHPCVRQTKGRFFTALRFTQNDRGDGAWAFSLPILRKMREGWGTLITATAKMLRRIKANEKDNGGWRARASDNCDGGTLQCEGSRGPCCGAKEAESRMH